MPRNADRELVQRLIDDGAQLAEVLPHDEYAEWHLPAAINVPLRRIDSDARRLLDAARPVVVYCWDTA